MLLPIFLTFIILFYPSYQFNPSLPVDHQFITDRIDLIEERINNIEQRLQTLEQKIPDPNYYTYHIQDIKDDKNREDDIKQLKILHSQKSASSESKESNEKSEQESGEKSKTILHLDGKKDENLIKENGSHEKQTAEQEIRKINDFIKWFIIRFSLLQRDVRILKGRSARTSSSAGLTVEGSGSGDGDDDYFYVIEGSVLDEPESREVITKTDKDDGLSALRTQISQLKSSIKNNTENIKECAKQTGIDKMEQQNKKIEKRMKFIESETKIMKEEDLEREKLQDDQLKNLVTKTSSINSTIQKWFNLINAVKNSHTQIFSALTEYSAKVAQYEANSTKLELRLANLQVDFLNFSCSHGTIPKKDFISNNVIQVKNDIEVLKKFSDEQIELSKMLMGDLKTKADIISIDIIKSNMNLINVKLNKLENNMQNVSIEIDTNRNAIKNLESELPEECADSMTTKGFFKKFLVIKPSPWLPSVVVSCDNDWTVIQERRDGRTPFNRTYEQYRKPFGEVKSDHWIGNEYIHKLSSPLNCSVRFEIWDIFGEYRVAYYNLFSVLNYTEQYRLRISGYDEIRSNLSEALSFHDGQRFSSLDRDEDSSSTHCARYYAAGWWFSNCMKANLNGNHELGIVWFDLKTNDWIHAKQTRISIRRNK